MFEYRWKNAGINSDRKLIKGGNVIFNLNLDIISFLFWHEIVKVGGGRGSKWILPRGI